MGLYLNLLLWVILTFSSSFWCIIDLPIPILISFSIVVFILQLMIVQVVISSEVRDIGVIHIPMRAIIISVSTQCSIFDFCVRPVFSHLIKEKIPFGLIADYFWAIFLIEVIFAAIYKTTTKTDRNTLVNHIPYRMGKIYLF